MPTHCPHCGASLPRAVDAFCPHCRESRDVSPPWPRPPRQRNPSRAPVPSFWVFYFFTLALLWGVRFGYMPQTSVLDLLTPLALEFGLCGWALSDARRRGQPIPLFSRSWYLVGAPFVVPGYLVLTRRPWGVGAAILYALGWIVIFITVAMVSASMILTLRR
jgi:hypothetical protein